MFHRMVGGMSAGAVALAAFAAQAAPLQHDQILPSNIIIGSGIANGGFTVDADNGVVVGLRAKVRYDLSDDAPKNVFNSNGDGTFNHAARSPAANPTRARWNVTWSVDVTDTGNLLDEFTYVIGLDFDAGVGTNHFTFDPINLVFADHGIGDRTTPPGAGDDDAGRNAASYAGLIANNLVAQNSWNWDFFDGPGFPFDPNADGEYSAFFEVYDGTTLLARSEILVIVGDGAPVPEPAALGLLGLGLVGLMAARRRKA